MSDGYEVDATRLAGQAGQLEPLAGRVAEIHRTLSDSLAQTGPCWGGDAVGQSFGAAHTGPADATLAQLSALPDMLGSVGDRLSATAARYSADDQSALVRLRAADSDAGT